MKASTTLDTAALDQLCINTIRTLAMDAVQKANSGHPGTPMALAPLIYVLYTRHLKFNPRDPQWPDRDRFVLSAGHASMLQYAILFMTGYDVSLDDLKAFRQWGSKTPGHPEYRDTPGIEVTTGPLGQGFGNGVGFAIAERALAARFNRPEHDIVDHYTYVICSDGDLMEGVSAEAGSLAGHLGLGRLIYFYDDNHITIEGNTSLSFDTEDVCERFAAYGWHTQVVPDVNDLDALDRAIVAAKADSRPSFIRVRSHIAYGAPHKQDTAAAHGAPLGEDEVRATKRFYGWPEDAHFLVPDAVLAQTRKAIERGESLEAEWRARFDTYAAAFGDLARQFDAEQAGELPKGWDAGIPSFAPGDGPMATRIASSKVMNAFATLVPNFLGGAADLAPSTETNLKGMGDFERDNYGGRNFHFGIREHAMGAILNGLAVSKVRAYGSGFLIFSDYGRATIRLAAIMEVPVIYVFTHDSIGVGEDGPTHQPIEQLASLRAIPNLIVIRPADANEVVEMWKYVMQLKHEPVCLILSRQDLLTLDRNKYASAAGVHKGAYVLADAADGKPDVLLLASGSEVALCLEAHERLKAQGVKARVVSMPCWELFDDQPQEYRDSVLPPDVTARVSVEQASAFGWGRYVGTTGHSIGMRSFGASAPLKDLLKKFGFTAEHVVAAAREQLRLPPR